MAIELVRYKKDKMLPEISSRFLLVSHKSPISIIITYLRMRLERAAVGLDEKTPIFLFLQEEKRLISRGSFSDKQLI